MPLRDGLALTIDWMRANIAPIDGCVQRHANRMSLPPELAREAS
jgi:hypothetical protein